MMFFVVLFWAFAAAQILGTAPSSSTAASTPIVPGYGSPYGTATDAKTLLPELACTSNSTCNEKEHEFCYDPKRATWLSPSMPTTSGICLGLTCNRTLREDGGMCRPGQRCSRMVSALDWDFATFSKEGRCLDARSCGADCGNGWMCIISMNWERVYSPIDFRWTFPPSQCTGMSLCPKGKGT
jgi:hypothetical protein